MYHSCHSSSTCNTMYDSFYTPPSSLIWFSIYDSCHSSLICYTCHSSSSYLIKYTINDSCDSYLECKQSKVHLLHKFLWYQVRSAAVWWGGECNLIPLQTWIITLECELLWCTWVCVCECVQVYDPSNLPITVVICDILQQIRWGNFLA